MGMTERQERKAPMQRKHLRFGKGFRVALGNARAQAAEMVLRTLNIYVPPAYTASGEERPPAKP
jgi:hypothetical protein